MQVHDFLHLLVAQVELLQIFAFHIGPFCPYAFVRGRSHGMAGLLRPGRGKICIKSARLPLMQGKQA